MKNKEHPQIVNLLLKQVDNQKNINECLILNKVRVDSKGNVLNKGETEEVRCYRYRFTIDYVRFNIFATTLKELREREKYVADHGILKYYQAYYDDISKRPYLTPTEVYRYYGINKMQLFDLSNVAAYKNGKHICLLFQDTMLINTKELNKFYQPIEKEIQ